MKKILFIMYDLNGGGAERVLLEIIKKLDVEKYEIDLLILRQQGAYLEELEELEKNKKVNKIFYLTGKRNKINKITVLKKISSLYREIKIRFFLNFSFLWKFILKNSYDVEIAFLEGICTEILANRKTIAKKVAWVHIDMSNMRKNRLKVYEKIDKIICVSNDAKKKLIELYPKISNKTEVIYNLLNREKIIEKSNEEVLDEDKLSKSKINLIASGRLTYQKGFDILLEAHKMSLKDGYDYNLIILGDGPERKKLENYIQENSIEKNTFLLGFKRNPYPYIKQADIFISSSRYEGYPLVLMEALALGKPVVATDCSGSNEMLEEGKYGIVVKKENVIELMQAIKKIISSIEIRDKYKKLSLTCSKKFDNKKIIEEIEKILNEN